MENSRSEQSKSEVGGKRGSENIESQLELVQVGTNITIGSLVCCEKEPYFWWAFSKRDIPF